jgi:hypothetical protein
MSGLASAKEGTPKAGPVAGTWECVAHGSVQGDVPFTLTLQQNKEMVTGTVATAQGEAAITTATYKKKVLDIHIEIPQGTYRVTGKLKEGRLSGDWSKDTDQKGAWEGKRVAPTKPPSQ